MNANFRGKGASPPTNFGIRKLESLGYRMVKNIAENFNLLSRVHQRHRRQTDGIATAYSERKRKYHVRYIVVTLHPPYVAGVIIIRPEAFGRIMRLVYVLKERPLRVRL